MSLNQLSPDVPAFRRRPVLSAGLAMTGAAITLTSLYLAAGVLVPLLVVYKEQWQFPAARLTLAFAVYAVGFLAALLTLGSLSDHVGRRPVLGAALVIQLASIVMFLVAPDIGWVIAARVVQGVATGAASSALTAALVELAPPNRKRLGTILGSVSVTGGLAIGSVLAGLAIQLTTRPNTIVFIVLSIMTILGIVVVALSPESARRTPGAFRSLVPRVAIPPAARREFAAAAPVIAAIWMLAGLSGGLAPSLVRSVFLLDSGLLNGVSGFIAPATSAVIGLAFGRVGPRRAMMIGIYASIVGAVGIMSGVFTGSLALMFIGLAIAGVGFGAAFTASLRLVFPLAAAHQRAGLVAGIYVVSYIAFGVPVVIVGQLAGALGEVPAVTWYTGLTVLLTLVSLGAQIRIKNSTRSVNRLAPTSDLQTNCGNTSESRNPSCKSNVDFRMTGQLSSACPNIAEGPKPVMSTRPVIEHVVAAPVEPEDASWLVALDIDGTTLKADGSVSDAVIEQVRRLDAADHQVMLATGRSFAATIPVLECLGITPQFLVCSNGAITLHRDPEARGGYRRECVESFDPTEALQSIRTHLENARFAVEDEHGHYRYTEPFPDATIGLDSEHVEFDELLNHPATRVVVISPDHDTEDFLAVVEKMGLHRVNYAIGWTAWLDIAAEGVNKATAMERVRIELGIPRERVMAVADGRNDIELLRWASKSGRGVAMGHSPADVKDVASEVTGTVHEDGLAQVLATL